MAVTKTIGGERIGSGNKMKVALRNYERSTHNLSKIWRSSMAPGVLVPFMCELGLNGDSFEIDLNSKVRTLPTLMPLFASFKMQMDVFFCPIRLYQGLLHNNMTKIGMQMNKVKLPKIKLPILNVNQMSVNEDGTNTIDNNAISPTSLLAYLGTRGTGQSKVDNAKRKFMAVPILAYYDIFKNYYSNKQEDNAYCVQTYTKNTYFTEAEILNEGPGTDRVKYKVTNNENKQALSWIAKAFLIPADTATESSATLTVKGLKPNTGWDDTQGAPTLTLAIKAATAGTREFKISEIARGNATYFRTDENGTLTVTIATIEQFKEKNPGVAEHFIKTDGGLAYLLISAIKQSDKSTVETETGLGLMPFPLENLDKARQTILKNCDLDDEVIIQEGANAENVINFAPYLQLVETTNPNKSRSSLPMAGLCVKTYQSDIFNNWLTAEWVEQISSLTEISGSSFTMDALNFKKKQYEILNAVAIAGGTWEDWQEAIYGQDAVRRAEIPIYMGGMSSEIVFDEVVSNSASETSSAGESPLGTLAGRGTESNRKGGNIKIRVDEPGFIIGIVSLTPRVDYSQGNRWYTSLDSVDDLHKPGFDGIGFQDLITEKMSAAEYCYTASTTPAKTNSAGKQPAWLDYMTNYNECFGDFAEPMKAMAMTLNRRYEYEMTEDGFYHIKDLTTYIDPVKYNYAFAQTSIDAQNFWVQIACDIIARRKISAKQMPNF